ncbi:MAG TPA: FAD-dependent oxidoreductase [Frankiaceae bacterium]|nr:FAD-dependent oxidoreductase [Frankiaceae bacterium]
MRVLVVGGGVLGAMHALWAHGAGHQIVHFEREQAARGASVRNFGLVWVGGRASGAELRLTQTARELWTRVAEQIPAVGLRPDGSVTVARTEDELLVMKEAAGLPDAAERGYRLLDPAGVRALNPALRGTAAGGLYCSRDAIVETAAGPGSDTRALEEKSPLSLESGHRSGGGPRQWRSRRARRVARRRRRFTALLPGLRAPGTPPPGAAEREGRGLEEPTAHGAARQRGAHDRRYACLRRAVPVRSRGNPLRPFAESAKALLGRPLPPTTRRWVGVYSETTDTLPYHRSELAPGVLLVTGPGGKGMTCSPAIAAETFAALS